MTAAPEGRQREKFRLADQGPVPVLGAKVSALQNPLAPPPPPPRPPMSRGRRTPEIGGRSETTTSACPIPDRLANHRTTHNRALTLHKAMTSPPAHLRRKSMLFLLRHHFIILFCICCSWLHFLGRRMFVLLQRWSVIERVFFDHGYVEFPECCVNF